MPTWKSYAGLVLAAVFWGASFVATKTVLQDLSPATITVSRFGLGLLVIFLMIGPKRVRKAFTREIVVSAVILGFLGITFHQWLQANGLKTAQATIGSWIVATIPIFVALLGRFALGERLGFLRSLGIGIASIGALFVIGKGNPISLLNGRVGTIGDLLFVISAVNWAVFTVISRGTMSRQKSREVKRTYSVSQDTNTSGDDPLGFMFVVMMFGWIFSLFWLVLDGGWGKLFVMQSQSVYSLIFLGIASSGLAYAFWFGGLQNIQAAQAGAFLYIEPFVTAALAWPILGERMSSSAFLGGGAIIVGVWLVNRPK
jgi:drug/metabolite transporter (DMT)-like permease